MSSPSKTGRTRKSLGRSISACLSCREKHTKCDETRPSCSKCIRHTRTCIYPATDPSKEWQRNIVTFNASESSDVGTKESSPATRCDQSTIEDGELEEVVELEPLHTTPNVLHPLPILVGEGYSTRDVHVLSHFVDVTSSDLMGGQRIWTEGGIQLAFNNDFLMHAVLMIGASQLQLLNPAARDEYRLQSARHLCLSLRYFRRAIDSPTYVSNNFDAILATSFLFLMHVCSNPTFDPAQPAGDGLLQHASALYALPRYNAIRVPHSPFRRFCVPKMLAPVVPNAGPALDLIIMIRTGPTSHHTQDPNDVGPTSHHTQDPNDEVYVAIVRSLAPILDIVISQSPFGGSHPDALLVFLIRWLSFLPPEFILLLNSLHAKALIIMSHYYAVVAFVLSKWKRGWWWMRERPRYMIEHTAAFLGKEWEVWMQWPLSVLKTCGSSNLHWEDAADAYSKGGDEVDAVASQGVLSRVVLHPCKFGEVYMATDPHTLTLLDTQAGNNTPLAL